MSEVNMEREYVARLPTRRICSIIDLDESVSKINARRVAEKIELEEGSGEDVPAKVRGTVENDKAIKSYSANISTDTTHLEQERIILRHLDRSGRGNGA